MSKVKILRIITRLNIGGPAIHAVLLTGDFEKKGYDSLLVSGSISKVEGDMGYLADGYDVRPVYVRQLKREISPVDDITALFKVLGIIKRYRPQIVHTHTAKAGMIGRLAAILSGVPVRVHTFHGNIFSGYFGRFASSFFIALERALARYTDAIVVISEEQKKEISEIYRIASKEKCRMIRLGFDLEPFLSCSSRKGEFRRSRGLNGEDILIGMVGRFTAIKNHKMFVDAAEVVIKNAVPSLCEKIKFVLVGDGELKEDIRRHISDRGLEEYFLMTGWIKDMPSLYADLDIAVLSSDNEGTPVSLIEALASSVPVVATDVGGVRDAIGAGGILIGKGASEAMGAALFELASSPDRRRSLASSGKESVIKMYSKERLINEHETLYEELLTRKKGNL